MSKKLITFCDANGELHDFPIETPDYGTCSTSPATSAKVVTCEGFSLYTGARIVVKFTYANTASSMTMNVNSTGAKTVRFPSGQSTTTDPSQYIQRGGCYLFIYDGTYWTFANSTLGIKNLAGETVYPKPDYSSSLINTTSAPIIGDLRKRKYDSSGNVICGNVSSAAYAVAMGIGTTATSSGATAMGRNSMAQNVGAAIGYGVISKGLGQVVTGKYNKEYDGPENNLEDMSGSIFIVGVGTGPTSRANAFRITTGGQCMGTKAFLASGADYAEYFEWLDGNPSNEDRRGKFVTLDGDKIRIANASDKYILGVVSADPSFIGNAYTDMWQGAYMTDIFGARLTETVVVPESVETIQEAVIDEESGETISEAVTETIPEHTETRFIVNPDYNPEQAYQGRNERKEWDAVGTHGQIVVIDDGTCQANSYCGVSDSGIGTDAETGYRVLKRLDESHIKVLIK